MGESPIPFEVGEGLADLHAGELGGPREFDLDEAWNTLTVHEPDGAQPSLAKGATEMFLLGTVGSSAWQDSGRMLVLHEDPSDGSAPKRHLVHVTEYEPMPDGLAGFDVTRVAWAEHEALPCPMLIADTTVKANVVPATAGETFQEFFSIRGDGSVDYAQDVVEREGPLNSLATSRPPLFRYSPRQCEALSLGWLGQLDASVPEIELQEADPLGDPYEWDPDKQWTWRRTLLDSIGDDEHFTLEDGTWRRIIGYRKPDGTELVHQDWAANAGYTIRFGEGEFGRVPADGTLFRVRYRSGPGSYANVGAGAIVHLYDPVGGTPPFDPDLSGASNPFDVTSGAEPETMQRAKFLAPVAFRHDTLSAVTSADYERLTERLEWVQRANASFRWTERVQAQLALFVPHVHGGPGQPGSLPC
ncbi:hypothetical protein [Enhygromyxa salina]|nr:hypothetical protein [Enhygromyxa salina]